MVNIQHGDDEIADERHGGDAEAPHTVFPPEEQQHPERDQIRARAPEQNVQHAVSWCSGQPEIGFGEEALPVVAEHAVVRIAVIGHIDELRHPVPVVHETEGLRIEAVLRLRDIPENIAPVEPVLEHHVRVFAQRLAVDLEYFRRRHLRRRIGNASLRAVPVVKIVAVIAGVIIAPVLEREGLFQNRVRLLGKRQVFVHARADGAEERCERRERYRHNVERRHDRALENAERHGGEHRRRERAELHLLIAPDGEHDAENNHRRRRRRAVMPQKGHEKNVQRKRDIKRQLPAARRIERKLQKKVCTPQKREREREILEHVCPAEHLIRQQLEEASEKSEQRQRHAAVVPHHKKRAQHEREEQQLHRRERGGMRKDRQKSTHEQRIQHRVIVTQRELPHRLTVLINGVDRKSARPFDPEHKDLTEKQDNKKNAQRLLPASRFRQRPGAGGEPFQREQHQPHDRDKPENTA